MHLLSLHLFAGQFFYVARFLLGLLGIFLVGGFLGSVWKLDRAYIDLDETVMRMKPVAFKTRRRPVHKGLAFLLISNPAIAAAGASGNSRSYLIGGIISLLILGYLVYTLIRPEKF